jgi:DNA-binding XRE family transcriptional regulator
MHEHPLTLYRRERSLTQRDIAELVGCSRWHINRIEKGERAPSWDLVSRLKELSGGALSADDFIRVEPAE